MNIGLLKFGFIQTGLSILQNGKLPQFIPDYVIASMFDVNNTSPSPCIENLRNGLKKFCIFQVQSFNFCKKNVLDFIIWKKTK